jgi:hopene-associated glycosyltransferase HpnB
MSAAALAIAAAPLAIWLYLLCGRGGFWLARERDEAFIPNNHIPHAEVQGAQRRASKHAERELEHPSRLPRIESGVAPQDEVQESGQPDGARWPSVMTIIPARDEAEVVGETVGSLLRQSYPGRFTITLVDDQSTDRTADAARRAAAAAGAADRLTVLHGGDLPPGWTGKLWAMRQGVAQAEGRTEPPDFVLFSDADIAYAPDILERLVRGALARGTVLTSLMVKLRCDSPAERLLIPAFIFFFRKLYPFAWVNDPARSTAAAAGGCMLVRREALKAAGSLEAIRGALIDDCALGALLKRQGPIWLGLTEDARSLRAYPAVGDIRRMVARSAYAELRYSPFRLGGAVLGMALTYLAPPLLTVFGDGPAQALGAAAWVIMVVAYQPMLRFYGLSPLWALALPAVAAIYMAFTIDSAVQHWQGRGGAWKGRLQGGVSRSAAQG